MKLATRRDFVKGLSVLAPVIVTNGFATSPQRVQTSEISIDNLLLRNARARGGLSKLGWVRTVDSLIAIEEQGARLIGRYRATRNGLMRIDVFLGDKRVASEGVDESGNWEWPGDKPAPSPAPEVAKGILERGIEKNLYSLHEQAARGAKFSIEGREVVGSTNFYVVRSLAKDGFETFMLFDPTDWLVKRSRDFRSLHPTADATKKWMEDEYEAFRWSQGIRDSYASKKIDRTTGKVAQQTTVLRQVYNRPAGELDLAGC